MPAFQQITDDGFPGAKSLDFIGQRFVYVEPFGRYWGWSDLADGTSWNSLEVAQAETSPDRIQGLIVSHNEVLIFGERTIEPWAHAPTETAVFQLQTGSVIESGCASGKTLKRLDNSVFFLDNQGRVCKLNGYTPQVISTVAMEAAIRDCNWSRAFATVYEDAGHAVYYITFPDGHTWGYDVRQGKWHRRQSYGLNRWRINTLCKSNGTWFAGDFQNGRVYEVEWGNVYEACEIMPRSFRSGVLHNASNRVRVDGFRLVAATGQPPIVRAIDPEAVPDSYLLITGQNKLGETAVWAGAVATASPMFTGLDIGTGADLANAVPASYDGRFVVVSTDDARTIEGSVTGEWETLPLDSDGQTMYALVGEAAGWMGRSNLSFDEMVNAANPPTDFVNYAPTSPHTSGAGGPWAMVSANSIFKAGGYYYASEDRNLFRASSPTGPWTTLHDQLSIIAAGDNPNGECIVAFYDAAKVGDTTYFITSFDFSLGTRRAQIRTSPDDGETLPDAGIILDVPFASTTATPWQLAVADGVVVVYCRDGSIRTSADDFVSVTPTGLDALVDGARKIATVGKIAYIIGTGGTDGDKCVVYDTETQTLGSPITLPIRSALGIAAIDNTPEAPGEQGCTPMEGGVFQLRYANDGSENWSNWRDAEPPRTGWMLQPLVWRRLGMARHRAWEVMDTSNRPQDVLAAEIIAQ